MGGGASQDSEKADDIPTLSSVGVLAYLSADIVHHLVGHAGACAALGGQVLSVSSILARCSITGAAVDVAGPLANLIVGLAAWIGLRTIRGGVLLRLVLLEVAGFNLFWFAGQLIFSAVARTDDWQQLLLALEPGGVWRAVFIAAGALAYAAASWALGRAGGGLDSPRLRRAMWLAWIGAGAVAGLTGLRDPNGLSGLVRHALPQALLLPIGLLFLTASPGSPPAAPIGRQPWLILAACVAGLASIAVLGPGLWGG